MSTKVINIVRKQTIRPSSPTPHNLKIHKLSLIDQLMSDTYTPIILFYSPKEDDTDQIQKSEKLQASLAQTLTHFYSFTGKLKDNSLIECEDQGAEYIEARFSCYLADILRKPEPESIAQLLPTAMESSQEDTGNLLLVQVTFFDCGGLAIGVCISHKIADASTLVQFIKFWSSIALGSEAVSPVFMADSMFPPREFSTPEKSIKIRVTKCITKRFVFDGPKIDALKEKAASANSPKPTRVEAVSGLIWRGVIKASNKSNPNMIRPSVWTFAMNLRPRFTPPIPDNYAGNLVVVMTPEVEEEIELKELVDMIKRGRQEFVENYIKKVEGKNVIEAICELSKKFREMALSDKVDLFISSAWCRFRFYDADFGWGRPTWLSTLSTNIRNFCILLDTKDGEGIETWITLSEEDMFWFESDEQILQFAQLNPSVTF